MKRKLAAMLALVMVIILAVPANVMAQQAIEDVPLIEVDGVVFVPLRLASYAFDASVEWEEATRSVHITSAAGDMWTVQIDAAGGFIEDGTSWVPLEYILGVFVMDIAEVPVAVAPAVELPNPQIHGNIHRIEYGDNVAYIFGSMHLGRPHWFPLADVVEEAITRADVFVFEFDIASLEDPAIIPIVEELILLPDGMTIGDVLTDVGMENLIALLESSPLGVDILPIIEGFTPVALNQELTNLIMLLESDVLFEYSVDMYVHAIAAARSLPSIGLNDVITELEFLFDVPFELQATLFDSPILWDDVIAMVVEMDLANAYETQNLDHIRGIISAPIAEYAGDPLMDHILNINFHVRCMIFAEEIARLLQETYEPTTFFVTIGLAHILGGELGQVLVMLEDMGFDVVPIWN